VTPQTKTPAEPKPGNAAGTFRRGEVAPSTEDLNVLRTIPLVSPDEVKAELPISDAARQVVTESRRTIQNILRGNDERMLVVVGPCSIHDEKAALEYASKLAELAREVQDRIHVVMRTYFEKPRTTIGWKGLINDPHLDGTFDIECGLKKARKLILAVAQLGLPAGTEMLDPITPQYIADLIAWSAIGARTIESQTHRQMASGLSMPVGYKNGTTGDLQIAIDAMQSALHPHSFLGIDASGRSAVIMTRGNQDGHIILRGGHGGPNFDPQSVGHAVQALHKAGLCTKVMVDSSHANSGKKHQNQHKVWKSVIEQRLAGNHDLIGILMESHLREGNQPFNPDPTKLIYGVSVTDSCVGWDETRELMEFAYEQLGR
jgi:3-deoxy-7-phosphoheptulonate synthase